MQSQPGTLDGGLKLKPLKECPDCGAVIEERDHDELTVRSLPCVCSHMENNPPAIDPLGEGYRRAWHALWLRMQDGGQMSGNHVRAIMAEIEEECLPEMEDSE